MKTIDKKEMLKTFFELKAQQIMCKIWLVKNKQFGYTQDQIGLMESVMKVETELEKIENEMFDLLMKNKDFFESVDLMEESKKPENKVTIERQRELALRIFKKPYCIDDFIE